MSTQSPTRRSLAPSYSTWVVVVPDGSVFGVSSSPEFGIVSALWVSAAAWSLATCSGASLRVVSGLHAGVARATVMTAVTSNRTAVVNRFYALPGRAGRDHQGGRRSYGQQRV